MMIYSELEGNGWLGPCEPHIDIDTTNTKNMIVGAVLDCYCYSFDGGNTWEVERIMSSTSEEESKASASAYGLNGEIYVSWSYDDKIYFNKSLDNGKSWLYNSSLVISEQEGGGSQNILGMGKCHEFTQLENINSYHDGQYFKSLDDGKAWFYDGLVISKQKGKKGHISGIGRCNGFPVTCVDRSDSKYRGTIYVNWSDQRNGSDNTDIWISKSTDQGDNWSEPIRVNQDNTKSHQFFTWMSVDPITGYIYIVYYDRSNYEGLKTDVSLAISEDGGITWKNEVISEKPFEEIPEDVFFGDFNNISAYNGVIRPVWTRYDKETGLSIWTAIINR
ncbi:sialidase family protein [Ichthyobacterium seriolicida]|uniref:sialidase family protein n=1 Tax=Ichthyobacterium seriolicida TaxID=242600 RepID=UPI0012FD158C|nr:sialidase family protein [Ichthyobacterium seriolicida]